MRKQSATRQAHIRGALRSLNGPITAHQILGQLKKNEPDIAPPSIYRAVYAVTDLNKGNGIS